MPGKMAGFGPMAAVLVSLTLNNLSWAWRGSVEE